MRNISITHFLFVYFWFIKINILSRFEIYRYYCRLKSVLRNRHIIPNSTSWPLCVQNEAGILEYFPVLVFECWIISSTDTLPSLWFHVFVCHTMEAMHNIICISVTSYWLVLFGWPYRVFIKIAFFSNSLQPNPCM